MDQTGGKELKRTQVDWWTQRTTPFIQPYREWKDQAERMNPDEHDALDYFKVMWSGELN